jgi:hypothetical protein
MPHAWKCFDGSEHPVSDGFLERVPASLSGLPAGEIRARLTALLARSNDPLDGHEPLSDDDRKSIEALTHVLNLNRALRFLAGRDYREVFGPDATLDQVHGNSITKDCGCVLQHMFDHNRRGEGGIEIHPHHSLAACGAHAHLKDNFREHHKILGG